VSGCVHARREFDSDPGCGGTPRGDPRRMNERRKRNTRWDGGEWRNRDEEIYLPRRACSSPLSPAAVRSLHFFVISFSLPHLNPLIHPLLPPRRSADFFAALSAFSRANDSTAEPSRTCYPSRHPSLPRKSRAILIESRESPPPLPP